MKFLFCLVFSQWIGFATAALIGELFELAAGTSSVTREGASMLDTEATGLHGINDTYVLADGLRQGVFGTCNYRLRATVEVDSPSNMNVRPWCCSSF